MNPSGYRTLMRLCSLHNYYAPVWLPETDEIMHPAQLSCIGCSLGVEFVAWGMISDMGYGVYGVGLALGVRLWNRSCWTQRLIQYRCGRLIPYRAAAPSSQSRAGFHLTERPRLYGGWVAHRAGAALPQDPCGKYALHMLPVGIQPTDDSFQDEYLTHEDNLTFPTSDLVVSTLTISLSWE